MSNECECCNGTGMIHPMDYESTTEPDIICQRCDGTGVDPEFEPSSNEADHHPWLVALCFAGALLFVGWERIFPSRKPGTVMRVRYCRGCNHHYHAHRVVQAVPEGALIRHEPCRNCG